MSKVPGRPRRAPGPGGSGDQTRLMAKIALMYYERGARQTDIAQELQCSEAVVRQRVSRATRSLRAMREEGLER